jgi:hypothetical protein
LKCAAICRHGNHAEQMRDVPPHYQTVVFRNHLNQILGLWGLVQSYKLVTPLRQDVLANPLNGIGGKDAGIVCSRGVEPPAQSFSASAYTGVGVSTTAVNALKSTALVSQIFSVSG